jgi:hypothetical protein
MTTTTETATSADVNFYFDPVCPFAWMTSKWLRMVTAQRNYTVDWKFISLRLINAEVDYDPDDAAGLWDHVVGLASFPGFAELKRSLRERPQLASFGVDPDSIGVQEDWHAGSRRPKK